MLTGNVGEWSEIYTLLKIIADKELYAGDKDLNKIQTLIFPIIKVLRNESGGTYEYAYDNDLVIIKGGKEEFRISVSEFHSEAKKLLQSLKVAKGSTFSCPDTEKFISSFSCRSLKASSSVKTDIQVVIHDLRTGATPKLGFSIKSQLGGASTLLNAGKTTNFLYKITGVALSDAEIEEVNALDTTSKIKDRIEKIRQKGGALSFYGLENATFNNNLVLIDSCLPKLLSEAVLLYYTSPYAKVSDLLAQLSRLNPLGYDLSSNHPFYSYKIKRFLTDVALGMMPSTVWTGELDATGGYLVVKEDGEVLCYHIYNRNEFEDYLAANTKLETASTSRHGFGKIYRQGADTFFTLNLQVRFTK